MCPPQQDTSHVCLSCCQHMCCFIFSVESNKNKEKTLSEWEGASKPLNVAAYILNYAYVIEHQDSGYRVVCLIPDEGLWSKRSPFWCMSLSLFECVRHKRSILKSSLYYRDPRENRSEAAERKESWPREEGKGKAGWRCESVSICPVWWCEVQTDRQTEGRMETQSILQHSQLKMPGGGCWVTTGQFSSSLLSPQLFSWLQISEPRRKQFPLVQWNLHSVPAGEGRGNRERRNNS